MQKADYEKLDLAIQKDITELSRKYNRVEKRWMLDSQEEVEAVQFQIRELRHRKTIAWEAYMEGNPDCPTVLKRMLDPIVRRRNWLVGNLKDEVNSGDGDRFPFPASIADFQPKHLKGFWSCPGCMLSVDNKELEDYPSYRKQISWCPQFLPAIAAKKDPDEYRTFIHNINPDYPFCYAGLLHTEMQTSPTEIKLVKYCDSCGYYTTESKQLAVPIDAANYEISLDQASAGSQEHSTLICKCNECGEIIFEEDVAKTTTDGKTLLPEYEKMLDQHYQDKHPGETKP